MTATRTIAVIPATGAQGTAVLRSLQALPNIRIRATTRRPDALSASENTSIHHLSLSDPTPEDLKAVFDGTWGVFLNLNSDDPSIQGHEYEIGKRIIDAAVEAGVQSIVFSSLPSAEAAGVPVASFDAKAKLQEYITSQPFSHTAFVQPGWYMSNFLLSSPEVGGGFPVVPIRRDDATEEYVLRYPRWGSKVPLLDVAEDFGKLVAGVWVTGRSGVVLGVSEFLDYQEMVDVFVKLTGKKARVEEIPVDEFNTLGLHLLEETREIFRLMQRVEGKYFGEGVENDASAAEELKRAYVAATSGVKGSELRKWSDWLVENVLNKAAPVAN